ncbi:MAG: lipoyl(octanoyl) transferase LipB [Bacteroidota bacterium]
MENQSIYRDLDYIDLGLIDYDVAWKFQKSLFEKRLNDLIPDTLLLLEHPNTYTLGKTADKNNLIGDDDFLKSKGIKVYDIDRGGDITYHGPGQIVGYPIFDLGQWERDAHRYLRSLEEVIIKTCDDFGLKTIRNNEHTGVWIEDRKICAIGIKISKWITMHGFAFNINTDLDLFNGIIPCGIEDKEVTSLGKELDQTFDIQNIKNAIIKNAKEIFSYDKVKTQMLDI